MADASTYLVLIETAGNQRHIFETNKLAENVGASQQIYLAGYYLVLEAVREIGGLTELKKPGDVLDKTKNPPIEQDDSAEVEVWYVSSGKAILFTRRRELAVQIVRYVTLEAMREYPGVTVRGAISEKFSLQDVKGLAEQVKKVHEQLEAKRSALPAPELRFPRLPITDECRTSGLPASCILPEGARRFAASHVVKCKRDFQKPAIERMQRLIHPDDFESIAPKDRIQIAKTIDHLEQWLKDQRYIAVIHADGNGMGQIFQSFHELTNAVKLRDDYINKLREFSLGIDQCTCAAFAGAINELATLRQDAIRELGLAWKIPVLPLIVGGDDLTLLCTGQIAIPLLEVFFCHFESKVEESETVGDIVEQAFGTRRIGMSAGVAIVKPHYPFYAAYEMAEGLLQSAKQVKNVLRVNDKRGRETSWPATAFDFHVHHSSSGDDIDVLRAELESRHGNACTRFWGGPYVVTDDAAGEAKLTKGRDWLSNHRWKDLNKWIAALNKKDEDDPDRTLVPRSQIHELRAALFAGEQSFKSRLKLIQHRYDASGLSEIAQQGVFREEPDGTKATALLDAISLAKLVVNDESPIEEGVA